MFDPYIIASIETRKSLSLNGSNQFLNLGLDVFNTLTEYTFCAWIKPQGVGTGMCIFAANVNANNSFRIVCETNSKLRVIMFAGAAYKYIIDSTNVLAEDEWQFISVSKNGSTHEISINGVLQTNYIITTDLSFGFADMAGVKHYDVGVLDRVSTAPIQYFDGNIFNPTMLDSALNITEINELKDTYDFESTSVVSDIVSSYKFEDENISGTTVYDVYGSNDATLENGANTSTEVPTI